MLKFLFVLSSNHKKSYQEMTLLMCEDANYLHTNLNEASLKQKWTEADNTKGAVTLCNMSHNAGSKKCYVNDKLAKDKFGGCLVINILIFYLTITCFKPSFVRQVAQ